jgi:hypothetical protein
MSTAAKTGEGVAGGLTFGWLGFEDWPLLAPIFEAQGAPMPSPETAGILAAVEGDKVVGFLVMQLVYHTEPLWVDESKRDGRLAGELVARMDAHFAESRTPYYSFSDNAWVDREAKRLGMKQLDYKVHVKEFK